MTSSLRNSIHRRNHKERSQLAHRAKLGLLEKHADYVKRARDYHAKQDAITRLQRKAADRNKDEFYFSMTKEKTNKGVHVHERGNQALPTDIVKVLKTQDENYVRTMRLANLKKIDRLKDRLTVLADLVKPGAFGRRSEMEDDEDEDEVLGEEELEVLRTAGVLPRPKGKKKMRKEGNRVLFVDNEEEARNILERSKTNESTSTAPEPMSVDSEPIDLGWKTPAKEKKPSKKSRKTKIDSPSEELLDEDALDDLSTTSTSSSRAHLLKELAARLARDTQLGYAQRELEMQRLLMGKGSRVKMRGAELVSGGMDDDSDDEDALDARKGKVLKKSSQVDEKMYKPRVYKWKLERKR